MWGKSSAGRRAYMKQWRANNREKMRIESRKQYLRLKTDDPQRNSDYHRRAHLKHTYGISLEQFQEMLLEQKGVCAVCGLPETAIRRGTVKSLDVDHDHETGQIRGLLCSACNTALGLLRDDPKRITALLAYMKRAHANG